MERRTDFDPQNAAKKLLREGRSGALATLMAGSGDPYCSLVNVATAADGAPLLLLSRLALHTKNILADPRVSLMIDERKPGDPLEGARVMLMGRAEATEDPEARRRYLDRQPEAEAFAGFGEFSSVIQQIGQHLRQPRGIAIHPQRAIGNRNDQFVLPRFDERSGDLDRLGGHGVEVQRLPAQPDLAAGDARDVEQIIH